MKKYIKKVRIRKYKPIISNDEINDIIKIIKSLEDSGLLLKGVTEAVHNEVKKQKGEFPSMLLGTLGASLLGNYLIGKGAMAKSVSEETNSTRQGQGAYREEKGKGVLRAGEGVLTAGYEIIIIMIIIIIIKWIFNTAPTL